MACNTSALCACCSTRRKALLDRSSSSIAAGAARQDSRIEQPGLAVAVALAPLGKAGIEVGRRRARHTLGVERTEQIAGLAAHGRHLFEHRAGQHPPLGQAQHALSGERECMRRRPAPPTRMLRHRPCCGGMPTAAAAAAVFTASPRP